MNWHRTDLANVIALLQSGSRPKGGVFTDTGEVMSLGGENIVQQGGVKLRDVKRVPLTFYEAMTKGHLQDRDVLINKDGANTGKVGLFVDSGDGPACINEHLFLLRGDASKITQEYLYYTLLSERGQTIIRNRISGSAQPGLKSGFTNNFLIDLPESTDEQEKIGEILGTLDRAIEQTEALIAKQQRIKTGLMQDLLTKGIDEHGTIRSEATHAFKDSPLGRIPVEWDVQSLDVLLTDIGQGWSPDCDSESAGVGEWGVLKTTAIVWEGFNSRENKRLPSNLKPRPHLEIKVGDVLMTRAGPNSRVGVVCYVYETEPMRILSDKLYRLETSDAVYGRFLVYSLSGFAAQRHLSNLKTGMAESQTNISQDIVRKLITVVPKPEEQRKIADLLDKASSEYADNHAALLKLHRLKHGLMHDLLTGERRVTPLLQGDA